VTLSRALSVAILASAGAWAAPSAFAQSVMIAPGVYTTPEISAKCQAYAAKRVPFGAGSDVSRQRVGIACVKKLSRQQKSVG